MRFTCKRCGFPASIEAGVSLDSADCPKCERPLELSTDERSVGCYELIEKIGSGGYGTVWRATKPQSNSSFALKLLPKRSFSDDDRIHLLRQVRSSHHLTHPRVVAARDFGEVKDFWFLVSDYVDGTPLGVWAKHHHPDAVEAASLCAAMGDAMHYVHSQGFVHRDLKPGNIILDRDNRPNIIDFGLCKCERDADMMAIERYRAARAKMRQRGSDENPTILGTPAYTSPEQASGDAFHTSPRSDIYSLGVIFYELLCGRRPFGGSGRTLTRKILSGRPLRPSRHRDTIPSDLDAICLKAIARRAHERYETAADFAEDCRNAIAGEAIGASIPRWRFWR